MYSELLDSTELEFDFVPEKEDTSISVEELAEQGATGFTVRLFVTPINGYTTRMLLIVYPLPLEELLDTLPSATVPQFPGIALDRGEAELGVRARHLIDVSYGQPICPAVIVTNPILHNTKTPSSAELRHALSSLLRRVAVPETKVSCKGLHERWRAIKADGEEQLKVATPDYLWPEAEAPAGGKSGRNLKF